MSKAVQTQPEREPEKKTQSIKYKREITTRTTYPSPLGQCFFN